MNPPSSFGGLSVATSATLFFPEFASETVGFVVEPIQGAAFTRNWWASSRSGCAGTAHLVTSAPHFSSFFLTRPDSMKTFSVRPQDVHHDWYVIDATDQVLGRLATQVAHRLRGKHKPEYTPHVDTGDYIVVINADQVRVTGNKLAQKVRYRHSGYPGGIKEIPLEDELSQHPARVIENAVKGMVPRNRLGRAVLSKLRVYAGKEHPHEAQNPKPIVL